MLGAQQAAAADAETAAADRRAAGPSANNLAVMAANPLLPNPPPWFAHMPGEGEGRAPAAPPQRPRPPCCPPLCCLVLRPDPLLPGAHPTPHCHAGAHMGHMHPAMAMAAAGFLQHHGPPLEWLAAGAGVPGMVSGWGAFSGCDGCKETQVDAWGQAALLPFLTWGPGFFFFIFLFFFLQFEDDFDEDDEEFVDEEDEADMDVSAGPPACLAAWGSGLNRAARSAELGAACVAHLCPAASA